jgi:hypothetical protein
LLYENALQVEELEKQQDKRSATKSGDLVDFRARDPCGPRSALRYATFVGDDTLELLAKAFGHQSPANP